MEIPGGLSTRLSQRTGCVRPQGMVHVFDAERVEIKYFSKECETSSRGLEPFAAARRPRQYRTTTGSPDRPKIRGPTT